MEISIKNAEFSDITDFTEVIKIITLAPEVKEDKFMGKKEKE